MFGVDIGRDAAFFLRFGDDVEGESRLAGRFRSENFYDASAGNTTNAKRGVESDRAGRNDIKINFRFFAEHHDGFFAEFRLV